MTQESQEENDAMNVSKVSRRQKSPRHHDMGSSRLSRLQT